MTPSLGEFAERMETMRIIDHPVKVNHQFFCRFGNNIDIVGIKQDYVDIITISFL